MTVMMSQMKHLSNHSKQKTKNHRRFLSEMVLAPTLDLNVTAVWSGFAAIHK